MKTALIAGICLLALSSTVTDALDKKDIDCTDLSAIQSCITDVAAATTSGSAVGTFCGDCRSKLIEYYEMCTPAAAEQSTAALNQVCGNGDTGTTEPPSTNNNNNGNGTTGDNKNSAATTGITLFTVISAVLVAVGY